MEVLQRYSKFANLSNVRHLARGRAVPVARPQVHNAERRLGAEAVAELVADYKSGIPTTELTGIYGIGKGAVLRLLKAAGVTMRQQPMTKAEVATAVRLYEQGLSLAKIGEEFGRDASVIYRTFRAADIPMRDTHGRQRT